MADFDTARLIYMAILGTVIAATVLGLYRNRMGQALQHALIWVLIVLGIVLAYGFKDQFSALLNPGQAVQQGNGAIAFYRENDGHFHADLTVNGVRIDFIVDTGATDIVLSREDARAAGINLAQLRYTGRASTANGTVRTARVRLDEVRLGDQTDRDVVAYVNEGDLFGSLLGLAYLDRFSSYTVRGDTLLLEP